MKRIPIPQSLAEAQRGGWNVLAKIMPREKDRRIFAAWRSYGMVPSILIWKQFWDPGSKRTTVLWHPRLAIFVRDAFLFKPHANLKGRRPRVGNGGVGHFFAPLRTALWVYRWEYDIELIRSTLLYLVDQAEQTVTASPVSFSRNPSRIVLSLSHRRGKNVKRAQAAFASLMMSESELEMEGRTSYRDVVRTLDRLIDRVRKVTFVDVRRVVEKAKPSDFYEARMWARGFLRTWFPAVPVKQKKRVRPATSTRALMPLVRELFVQHKEAIFELLLGPLTFPQFLREQGVYIAWKMATRTRRN